MCIFIVCKRMDITASHCWMDKLLFMCLFPGDLPVDAGASTYSGSCPDQNIAIFCCDQPVIFIHGAQRIAFLQACKVQSTLFVSAMHFLLSLCLPQAAA